MQWHEPIKLVLEAPTASLNTEDVQEASILIGASTTIRAA